MKPTLYRSLAFLLLTLGAPARSWAEWVPYRSSDLNAPVCGGLTATDASWIPIDPWDRPKCIVFVDPQVCPAYSSSAGALFRLTPGFFDDRRNLILSVHGSFSGVKSADGVNWVPATQASTQERNKWRALIEYQVVDDYYSVSDQAHVAVFSRVNDFKYDSTPNSTDPCDGIKDQTRFGIGIRKQSQDDFGFRAEPIESTAFLQFTFQGGVSLFRSFQSLAENPFDYPFVVYRSVIVEWEALSNGVWQRYWKGEILRADGTLVGWSAPVSESELTAEARAAFARTGANFGGVPALANSRLAVGWGPGSSGQVRVVKVETDYWSYGGSACLAAGAGPCASDAECCSGGLCYSSIWLGDHWGTQCRMPPSSSCIGLGGTCDDRTVCCNGARCGVPDAYGDRHCGAACWNINFELVDCCANDCNSGPCHQTDCR
jgi:hypothetical protein